MGTERDWVVEMRVDGVRAVGEWSGTHERFIGREMNGKNGGRLVRHIEVRDALYFPFYFLVQVELVWLRPFRNATRQQKKYHVSPKLPE